MWERVSVDTDCYLLISIDNSIIIINLTEGQVGQLQKNQKTMIKSSIKNIDIFYPSLLSGYRNSNPTSH